MSDLLEQWRLYDTSLLSYPTIMLNSTVSVECENLGASLSVL